MKKVMCLAIVIVVVSTGCALFQTPVINESRDNLVTQLKADGVIIEKLQYMDMLDNKGVPCTRVPADMVGKYYMPAKFIDVKDNQVFLKQPEKSAISK